MRIIGKDDDERLMLFTRELNGNEMIRVVDLAKGLIYKEQSMGSVLRFIDFEPYEKDEKYTEMILKEYDVKEYNEEEELKKLKNSNGPKQDIKLQT